MPPFDEDAGQSGTGLASIEARGATPGDERIEAMPGHARENLATPFTITPTPPAPQARDVVRRRPGPFPEDYCVS